MRRIVLLLAVMSLLLINAAFAAAQESTPESTAEIAPTLTEIFAGLPQSRTEDGGFVVGNPDAPITIVEFADFACPHCQNYREVIDPIIVDYVATGMAKYEFRIFPTAGGDLTYFVGKVLECADNQREGAFWEGYELLYDYAVNGRYDEGVARLLSRALGVNYTRLLICSQEAEQIDADAAFAREVGVSGTPGIVVRYGDSAPRFITYDGFTFQQGGVPYDVLAAVIEGANDGVIPTAEAPVGESV